MDRPEPSDAQWIRLRPLLPPQKPRTGRPAEDLRIDVDVTFGETDEATIPVGAAPGEYAYYGIVPGHKPAGTVGTLVIVAVTDPTGPAVPAGRPPSP